MTDRRPYPYGRYYTWAHAKKPHTPNQALLLFTRMRSGGLGRCTPARTATFDRMIELIKHLHEARGVVEFPGQKLHTLLIKAAEHCGWYATHGEAKRAQQPIQQPDGTYQCQHCMRCFPPEDFQRPYSDKEVTRYRSRPHAREPKKINTQHCALCRKARAESDRRRKEATAERKRATRIRKGKFDRIYSNTVHMILENYRSILAKEERAAFRKDYGYYLVKQQMVRIASARLDELFDSRDMSSLISTEPDWHLLLTKGQNEELELAYQTHLQAQRRGAHIKR